MKSTEISGLETDLAILKSLENAVSEHQQGGSAVQLRDWVRSELDRNGFPRHLAREQWDEALALISASAASGRRIPGSILVPFERWAQGLAAFCTPAGSAYWSEAAPAKRTRLAKWLAQTPTAGLPPTSRNGAASKSAKSFAKTVMGWDDPLISLRDRASGVWLGLDHRSRARPCRIELGIKGKRLLGGEWVTSAEGRAGDDPLVEESPLLGPIRWSDVPRADLFEWSWKAEEGKRTRTPALLAEQATLFVSDLIETASPRATLRIALPEDVESSPVAESRALLLKSGPATAVVVPLGLPQYPGPTEHGSLLVVERDGRRWIELTQTRGEGEKHVWLPLAITWRSVSNRAPLRWRVLSVSERGKLCKPGTAFAARLAWARGPGENLLFYKSFGKAGVRAFLGRQTRDRVEIAKFSDDGSSEPIVGIAARE